MKKKTIILGCSAAFLLFCVVVGVGVWLLFSTFIAPFGYRPETPAELREPRIIVGEDLMERAQFLKVGAAPGKSIGSISDILVKKPDHSPSFELVVAGNSGALIADHPGGNERQVQYHFETDKLKVGPFETTKSNTMLGDIQIIDVEGDGVFEYMGRGSIDGTAIFDNQGKRLWSYGKFTEEKTAIDSMAAGDLDGDGVDEFAAVWDGIELLDRHGAIVWRQEAQYRATHIDIVDTDGNGKNEIVYSSMGDLIVRDGKGKIVDEVEMPFYLTQFAICRGPDQQPKLLAVQDGYVWLTDFKGQVSAKFNAPLSEIDTPTYQTPIGERSGTSVYKAKGVWVKLKDGEPEHFVVITEYAAIDRSVLYIYKASGEVVYQEVLPEQCSSIAVLPKASEHSSQEFLIGGEQTVWRYKFR